MNGRPWPASARVRAADRAQRADRDQHVEAEHRRRQHQRQRDDRLDEELPAPRREHDPVRERHADRQQHQRRGRGEADAEPDRGPVHALAIRKRRSRTASRIAWPSALSRNPRSARAASTSAAHLRIDAALLQARIGARRASRTTRPLSLHVRRERQRQRHDAASAAPLCTNCIACATFSPNTSFGRTRVVDAGGLHRRHRGAAVRRVLGVRDRDVRDRRVRQRRAARRARRRAARRPAPTAPAGRSRR